MNDDTTPDDAGLSPEEQRARDALRATPAPALSDLERRRLVRGAMEATEPAVPKSTSSTATRRWLAVGAAAAALVVVVVSVSWLSGRAGDADMADGGGASTDAASEATAESDGAPDADSVARDLELVDLGALGSFDDDEDVVAAFDAAGRATTSSDVAQGYVASTGITCSDALPDDFLPLVVGTLTLDGTVAVIFGGETSEGTTVAYLLDASECTPLEGWDPRPL